MRLYPDGVSICLEQGHLRIHKHKRKMGYFIPRISGLGTYHITSSECCKGLAGAPTGDKAHSSLAANRSAWLLSGRRSQLYQMWSRHTGLQLWSGQAWLRRKFILPLGLKEKLSGIFWGQFIFPHVNNINSFFLEIAMLL